MSTTLRYRLDGDDDVRQCESPFNPEGGDAFDLEWSACDAARDWYDGHDGDAHHGWPRTFVMLRADDTVIGRVRIELDWTPEFYGSHVE